MLHELTIKYLNKMFLPQLSDLLLEVEAANRDTTSIMNFSEWSHFNQVETILIHKQIEYQISQEHRTDQRTAKEEVTTPYVDHWFELGENDFVFLENLLNKFKLYSSGSKLTSKKTIAVWIALIVDVRKKLLC
jgi:hypothetical protein